MLSLENVPWAIDACHHCGRFWKVGRLRFYNGGQHQENSLMVDAVKLEQADGCTF